MGKIIALIHLSLDGYMADAEGQINWVGMNEEISGYVTELRQGAAGTIYGRKTYQMMDPYWPNVLKDPGSYPAWQVDYARWVDKTLKVVVSRTLTNIAWNNTRLINDHIQEEITQVKQEAEGRLLLLASATLAGTLFSMGLIDEVVTTVNPIILGQGQPYFIGLKNRVPLQLIEERKFSNGVMALHYQVK